MIMHSEDYPHGRWTPRRDSSNQFGVTPVPNQPDWVKLQKPVMGVLTRAEAINLAAWLIATLDPKRELLDPQLNDILKH